MSAASSKYVIVGMSGGVDSSVAALLLLQQGYHVEGLFMKNWEEDDTESFCSATQDIADAQSVCDSLGIKLHLVNFAAEYWDSVFEYFLEAYKAGRTPNPDILCNKEIKFKAFLEYAQHLGADAIATGHYARCQPSETGVQLLKGLDTQKDQSYFLYALNQHQLANSLMPIGELEKEQVRLMAKKAGFTNHSKKDSTGICFIGERKFKQFLQHYLPAQPGNIETLDGKVLGQHDGLMFHTIGQRQGLNIGGRSDAKPSPWYVLKKDLSRNVLIVGQGNEHPALFAKALRCHHVHWISEIPPADINVGEAKIRYRQAAQPCDIHVDENDESHLSVTFQEPQRAITPGQAIVFYQGEQCLGGATITEACDG